MAKRTRIQNSSEVAKIAKKPRIQNSSSVKLCEVCGRVPTHRLVDGLRTCTSCLQIKDEAELKDRLRGKA
ncbi:hypothetical protein ES703_69749 [subsurface metagenome]